MNERGCYSDYDGSYLGGSRKVNTRRSMREIKADFNKNLQKHSISKVKNC